ncbi:MAG: hypothetical protein Kow0031_20740 [Anaerolineae bacterium]
MARAAWLGIAVTFSAFVALSGNGYEWRYVYEPATASNFSYSAVANPNYLLLLFYPLSWLPVNLAVFVITMLSFGSIYLFQELTGASRWLTLIFSQTVYVLLVAQIDLWIAFGAALGFYALRRQSGGLLGVSLIILMIKPQLGFVLAALYFFQCTRKQMALLTAGAIFLVSLLVLGFWVTGWVQKILLWSQSDLSHNVSLYPYGIVCFLLPVLFRRYYTPTQWYSALMSCSMLSVPYVAEYSLVTVLAFPHPAWFYWLSWGVIFLPSPWRGATLPVVLLLYPLIHAMWRYRR